MKRYFRTDDGFLLWFYDGFWTDGNHRFLSLFRENRENPVGMDGEFIAGSHLNLKTGDQLISEITDTLAEVGGGFLARIANEVLSQRHAFLTREGANDLFEVNPFFDSRRADTYRFDPPLTLYDGSSPSIEEVQIEELEGGGMFDLYDQDGNLLNDGWWPFHPTAAEVREYVTTGEIQGKIIRVRDTNE